MAWNLSEIVVEREQDAEGEEESESGDEMPNIVVIVEIEQDALGVLLPRLGRGHVPIGFDLKEKVNGDSPGETHK